MRKANIAKISLLIFIIEPSIWRLRHGSKKILQGVPQLGRPLSPWTVILELSDRITMGPTLRRVGLYCKAHRARLRHPRAALATEPRKSGSAPRGHYP